MIKVENLVKIYRIGKVEVPALRGISLSIEPGEFVAIMGPSGSGKSTFMNIIGCLDRPTSGSYFFKGEDVKSFNDNQLAEIRNRELGFVFQSFNLFPRSNALRNVELPLIYRAVPERGKKAKMVLDLVGLGDRINHLPSELSGGQQQRVAIARALVNNPSTILADEPTGNLDSKAEIELMDIFLQLNQMGITIILVTHEDNIAQYARRIIRFRDGKIVSDQPNPSSLSAPISKVKMENYEPTTNDRLITSNSSAALVAEGIHSGVRGNPAYSLRRQKFKEGLLVWLAEAGESIRIAFSSLRTNKLRSALTLLGILIGVTAVVALVSVGQGAKRNISEQMESIGTNLLTIQPGSARGFTPEGGFRQMGAGSRQTLKYEDSQAILSNCQLVKGVVPEISTRVQVKYRNQNWSTSVTGTTSNYTAVRKWNVELGNFFTEEDNLARLNICVLGRSVVDNLLAGEDPLGKTIRIGTRSFQVIGVMETKGTQGFSDRDDVIFVPLFTAQKKMLGADYLNSISVEVVNKESVDEARSQIEKILQERHKIKEGEENDFNVFNLADIETVASSVANTLTLVLASIAGISLIVGGIGIMNIMLVSVTERTREIGLRKAVGARRRNILGQFLIESIILATLGGITGLMFGWVGSKMISKLGGWRTYIPWQWAVIAVGFAAAVGLFSGVYPARKAAKLDPIVALRYE